MSNEGSFDDQEFSGRQIGGRSRGPKQRLICGKRQSQETMGCIQGPINSLILQNITCKVIMTVNEAKETATKVP